MKKDLFYYMSMLYLVTINSLVWNIKMFLSTRKKIKKDNNKLVIFDTSIGSKNLGDEVIMDYCMDWIEKIFKYDDYIKIPMHTMPQKKVLKEAIDSKNKIVCGTNLLYSDMSKQKQWRFGSPFCSYKMYSIRFVLLFFFLLFQQPYGCKDRGFFSRKYKKSTRCCQRIRFLFWNRLPQSIYLWRYRSRENISLQLHCQRID